MLEKFVWLLCGVLLVLFVVLVRLRSIMTKLGSTMNLETSKFHFF